MPDHAMTKPSTRTPKRTARRKPRPARQPLTAATADRHDLYTAAVQNVAAEIDFVDQTYKTLRGQYATRLREDFCGTAQTCAEWVRRRPGNVAVGLDLDEPTLQWGREKVMSRLTEEQQARVILKNRDVRDPGRKARDMDLILAMNFSYMIFKTRDSLREYFARARDNLAQDGMLVIDVFGGYEAFKTLKERTRHDDFTYVWEQASYNPIDGHMVCHIHFAFPDKSKLKRAFTYEWRLWTLPELQELLLEAGFSKATVYWQGWDEDDEPDGDFQPATEAESDPGWVSFVVAEK